MLLLIVTTTISLLASSSTKSGQLLFSTLLEGLTMAGWMDGECVPGISGRQQSERTNPFLGWKSWLWKLSPISVIRLYVLHLVCSPREVTCPLKWTKYGPRTWSPSFRRRCQINLDRAEVRAFRLYWERKRRLVNKSRMVVSISGIGRWKWFCQRVE